MLLISVNMLFAFFPCTTIALSIDICLFCNAHLSLEVDYMVVFLLFIADKKYVM